MMQVSLWDAEDLHQMPAVREMAVGPVTTSDVEEFCRRYHYTGVGNNVTWRWGLWHGPYLLGIVSYNLPTRPVCASVFGEEHVNRVWHMGRLTLPDHVPPNSESRLIGGSLRAIAREHPDVWAVLTYAATDAGHIGYVYQATNALYTGTGGHAGFYTDTRGHRRTEHQGGEGGYISRARAIELGWTRHQGDVKHRYVYLLGSARQRRQRREMLRLPVLAYPKQSSGGDGPGAGERPGPARPERA